MWDFSTMLGVVGVVLTVAFFVIGYRQTIGARKERAKAANRQIIEALFRRLVLDGAFPLDRAGVRKVLLGTALSASVRTDDIFSVTELEAVLYAKSMESDYIDDSKRIDVMNRLTACFSEAEVVPSSLPKKRQGQIAPDVWLAAGAAITAMVATLAVGPFFGKTELNSGAISEPFLGALLAGLGALTGLTAVALTAFTRLRDLTRKTSVSSISVSGHDIEQHFIRALKKLDSSVTNSRDPAFDFLFKRGSENCAVEIKADINRHSKSSILAIIRRMEEAASKLDVQKMYIISQTFPSDTIRSLEKENLKFMSFDEFYEMIKTA